LLRLTFFPDPDWAIAVAIWLVRGKGVVREKSIYEYGLFPSANRKWKVMNTNLVANGVPGRKLNMTKKLRFVK
jgi:hypothetical protein